MKKTVHCKLPTSKRENCCRDCPFRNEDWIATTCNLNSKWWGKTIEIKEVKDDNRNH